MATACFSTPAPMVRSPPAILEVQATWMPGWRAWIWSKWPLSSMTSGAATPPSRLSPYSDTIVRTWPNRMVRPSGVVASAWASRSLKWRLLETRALPSVVWKSPWTKPPSLIFPTVSEMTTWRRVRRSAAFRSSYPN